MGVKLFLVKLDGNALASCTPTSRDSGSMKYNQMLPLFLSKESNILATRDLLTPTHTSAEPEVFLYLKKVCISK